MRFPARSRITLADTGRDASRVGVGAHLHAFTKELAKVEQSLSNGLRRSNPEKVVRPDLAAKKLNASRRQRH